MKVIMDSDAIIKLAKSEAKEVVLKNTETYIPLKVIEEVITTPKEEGFPDAFIIEDNLKNNLLKEMKAEKVGPVQELIHKLNIKGGEAEVLKSFKQGKFDVISSDDSKFLDILESLNIPYVTPTSLIVYLSRKNKISESDALKYLKKLREFVSEVEYHFAIDAMGGD